MEQQRFDIDMNFGVNPLTKDLIIKRGRNAIKQSLKNIVLTSFYDRGFNVEFGANVYKQLFEADSLLTAKIVQTDIVNAIKNFEPDVELVGLPEVEISNNTLLVNIRYVIFNTTDTQLLTVELHRVR
jgi:baseplate wedge subunit|nr:MAG TPA: Baseplate wedge protein [Ackermannviridae sp.]